MVAERFAQPPAGPRLPRAGAGTSPQHLLLTLLGDYWFDSDADIPSAGLVALLGEFGISAGAGRAALSRLGRRDLLQQSRAGRTTRYRMTQQVRRVLNEGLARIDRFSQAAPEPWDGEWTVAVFSVPEQHRDLRSAVRVRLRWAGFAHLLDALWVSPRAEAGATVSIFRELGVDTGSVLRGRWHHESPLAPVTAWDLEHLRGAYLDFASEHLATLERLRAGRIGAAEALIYRTRLMDQWRRFPSLDPDLPDEVLPEGWPRDRSRATFVALYDGLGDLAVLRARQIMAGFDGDLAAALRHHTLSAPRPDGEQP